MKQTIVKCDICGSTEHVLIDVTLPVYRTTDCTEGRMFYNPPVVTFERFDICAECLIKATNIHDNRVMGYGDISIEKNPELFKKEDNK